MSEYLSISNINFDEFSTFKNLCPLFNFLNSNSFGNFVSFVIIVDRLLLKVDLLFDLMLDLFFKCFFPLFLSFDIGNNSF